jgi:hypothetical protein
MTTPQELAEMVRGDWMASLYTRALKRAASKEVADRAVEMALAVQPYPTEAYVRRWFAKRWWLTQGGDQ